MDAIATRLGETLSGLGKEVPGDAKMAPDLVPVLARPNSLRAGMILDLP
jgi:hypothetical protein